jgi:hypothetical protein
VGAGALDASGFLMTIVFCVAIALAVSTLRNISFLFWRLKFYLALLKVFDIKYVFAVRGGF